MHETDVLVVDHGFDLYRTVGWNDRQKGLGRGDDPADRMDRQLLNRTVDRRRERLILRALLGLGNVLRQTICLANGFGEIVEESPVEFCPCFFQLGFRRDDGSFSLLETAGLHLEVFLI
jgi:hypothetical protein